jgi:ribulose-5-phosphate 4-epimerase/fuculose-1-phosphate aldolase
MRMYKRTDPKTLPSLKGECSPEEWEVRVNLAACYRLFAHYRWTDLIHTHISARLPGDKEEFLINPYGLLFDEITATSLVKIDCDANVIDDRTNLGVNPAGFMIHSAVHMARHDLVCVMHSHTAAGIAVSCQKDGLLFISQHAMRFHNRIAYHNYDSFAFSYAQREGFQKDLGNKKAMFLRNHGLLVGGTTIREAFDLHYYLERACQAQVTLQSCGVEYITPDPMVAEETARGFERPNREANTRDWPALLAMLDRADPSYAT